MYPNVGFDGNNTISFDGETAGGLIPSSQTLRLMNSGNYNGKYLPEMKYAYMLAYKSIASGSSDHDVNLPFRPAFTAFNFRLRMPQTPATGTSGASYKVKSFTMTTLESGASLAGNFSVDIAGLFSADGKDRGAAISNLSVTGGSASITASFVDANHPDGVSLSNTSDLDFTLLALPRNITKVVLTLTYLDADGTEVTKSVQLGGHGSAAATFDACKKYIITNTSAGFDEWEYVIEPIDDITTYGHGPVSAGFEVRSYKQSKADPSIKVAVPWKIQYTLNPSAATPTWTDLPATGYVNSLMATTTFKVLDASGTNAAVSGPGSVPSQAADTRTSKIDGTHSSYQQYGSGAAAATRAKLASAPQRGEPVGTGNGPFDLSKHPSYGSIDTEVPQTTANSYVVSAPGYYMFPCVYGNAITKGQDNKSAYAPSQSTDPVTATGLLTLADVNTQKNVDSQKRVYYTPAFFDALNGYITSPWIKSDILYYSPNASFTDAVVVWQDTEVNDEIIPYTLGNIGLTTVGGKDYIWFYIDKDNIKPGNIMIALRGSAPTFLSGTTNILWSWQIWVTEKDLTPTADDVLNGYDIMPYNLGWIDTEEGSVTRYDNRELLYRVIQLENNVELTGTDNTEEFKMTQIGDAIETSETIGGNPYYQWGRKDPFLSALPDGTATSRPVSPNPEYSTVITTNGAVIPAQEITKSTTNYQQGIIHPYIPYTCLNLSTGWIGGPVYPIEAVEDSQHYRLLKIDRGPFNGIEAGWLNSWGITNSNYWDLNQSTSLWTYRASGPYNTYVDANTCYLMWNNMSVHFSVSDFCQVYPASKRSMASCPYNLWNSYLYEEDAPNNDVNKFKTVYDPCPPGFTVPVRNVFIGSKTVANDFSWVNAINKSTSSNLTVTSRTDQGVTVGNSFFPYTGGRVYHGLDLKVEHVTTDGMYWTDGAFTIEYNTVDHPSMSNANKMDINYHTLYHSAISFCLDASRVIAQAYTRGTALSIRPMVDPKY